MSGQRRKPRPTTPAVKIEEVEQVTTLGKQLGIETSGEFTETVTKLAEQKIEEGDHVYVGAALPDKVHWIVEHIPERAHLHPDFPSIRLRSPMSSRTRSATPNSLTLHSKGERDGDTDS